MVLWGVSDQRVTGRPGGQSRGAASIPGPVKRDNRRGHHDPCVTAGGGLTASESKRVVLSDRAAAQARGRIEVASRSHRTRNRRIYAQKVPSREPRSQV